MRAEEFTFRSRSRKFQKCQRVLLSIIIVLAIISMILISLIIRDKKQKQVNDEDLTQTVRDAQYYS